MADQVLAQIKQEGLERELDEAVRAATCVDVAHLQRAIARAEAECDPDYPIAPHLLAQAQSRLGMLLELQALRLSLLGRLAQAVDVEVADQIDEVLTAIDATEEVNEQVRLVCLLRVYILLQKKIPASIGSFFLPFPPLSFFKNLSSLPNSSLKNPLPFPPPPL